MDKIFNIDKEVFIFLFGQGIVIIGAFIVFISKQKEAEIRSDEKLMRNEEDIKDLKGWRDRFEQKIDNKLDKIIDKFENYQTKLR